MKSTIKILALVLVLAMTMCVLVSCAPNADPEKALAALKDNGYTAAKSEAIATGLNVALALAKVDATAETVVSGTMVDDEKNVQTVTIVYFKDAKNANEAWETVKEYAEDNKKDDEGSDWTIAKSGAMIYYGTKAGIKAAG